MASIQRIAIKDIALNNDRRVGGKGALETLKTSIETIDRVIGQMMRMPLDFPCEDCEQCMAKRTHYGSTALFPEYNFQSDYCMDSRCYEKNVRSFYQNAVSEFLKNWSDAKAVYIYEECKEDAERLRSILEKKPLIEAAAVHVYHESFEECSAIRVLDNDEEMIINSFSSNLLKKYSFLPVLYFQDKWQEPIFYIAVDDTSYEELFPSDSNEAEKAEGSDEAVESDGYDTGGNDGNNQAQNASGAEQAAKEEVDARDKPLLKPYERIKIFKQACLEYLQLERKNARHLFFYSPAFRRILENVCYFEEIFQIIIGTSLQDFYQQKKYEDLTYQQLLEIYVYSDILMRWQSYYHHFKVVNGVPILKELGLDSDTWRTLYQNARYHFLQERANTTPKETEQRETEKKTAVTAGTSA